MLLNTPIPQSILIEPSGVQVTVTLIWAYEQGEVPADRFLVFWADGRPPTSTDEGRIVPATYRSFRHIFAAGECLWFGVAAVHGEEIGPIITSQSSPDWEVCTAAES